MTKPLTKLTTRQKRMFDLKVLLLALLPMTESNLSKIKPQLRTTGNITGNFGVPKPKAGSPLNEINGNHNPGSLPTKLQYTMRLIVAYPSLPERSKPNILQQVKSNVATLGLSPTLYSSL